MPPRGSLRSPERAPWLATVAWFAAGLALLVALSMLGDAAMRAARLPVPGSVAGMLALALLVETGIVPVRLVQPAADLLVRHLALLYVPAGVALLAYVGVVRPHLLAIAVAGLASLVAVLVTVATIVQRLGRDE